MYRAKSTVAKIWTVQDPCTEIQAVREAVATVAKKALTLHEAGLIYDLDLVEEIDGSCFLVEPPTTRQTGSAG